MSGPAQSQLVAELRRSAAKAGLRIGFTTAELLEPAATILPLRRKGGLAADMQFTYRRPERSSDPRWSFPEARSIVAAALPYATVAPVPEFASPGRVARYTWSDQYGKLRAALGSLAEVLVAEGHRCRIHADENHLVDRNVAWRAGLGWWGKNANLLVGEWGSWVVLGSILTTAELPPGEAQPDQCGPCRRCLDDCPTEAIVGPGVVDANRCLAWLVQARGAIPREFRAALGDRIYGCDDCQEVCPPSSRPPDDSPLPDDPVQAWVDIEWVLSATDEELLAEVGRWYLADRNPDVVRRTALVIVGNQPPTDSRRALLERYCSHPNPMLRGHALWAARRHGFGEEDTFAELRSDPSEEVRAEWEGIVEPWAPH